MTPPRTERTLDSEPDLPGLVRSEFRAIPPRALFDRLSELGYKGQPEARKALCLTAYRHMRRVERILFHKVPPEQLPPKTNVLLMGPTGCGKTFLVETLFGKLMPLPVVVIDITGFSETGYVGDSVKTIITRLVRAGQNRTPLIPHGVVCIDEFDKLAGASSNLRFDGAGTTKDVSGYGVQKELLKMIEGFQMDVPLDFCDSIYSERAGIRTHEILFIASGAFSGFKGTARVNTNRETIGFNREKNPREPIAYSLGEDEADNIAAFQQYGFLPELIGRFGRIIAMAPLSRETLHRILADNYLPRFVAEFEAEGIRLEIAENVLDSVVDEALKKQIGARGLGSRISKILEETAFDSFGQRKGTISVSLRNGKPMADWS